MRATVCKEFDFHAAHVLPNHDGQCSRLHGHTYKVQVFACGDLISDKESPKYGMVLDFSDLKKIYKEEIEPLVEHQYLNETLKDLVPVTTAEQVAHWIYKVFKKHCPQLVKVRLYETPTSYAEVKNGDYVRG